MDGIALGSSRMAKYLILGAKLQFAMHTQVPRQIAPWPSPCPTRDLPRGGQSGAEVNEQDAGEV